MGESSRKTSLERHEEQIKEILNHLDELSLDRIEHMEDKIEVRKMEDEFYNLTVKGNYLKTYVRRFQELAVLCPNLVPNTKKLMEVFIRGLPRSIEGNVTASKPQTLEEATTITQRLMDQGYYTLSVLKDKHIAFTEKSILAGGTRTLTETKT
ncbi:reverse transcriptase domain-containing protein [Tanacetum coccineum]